MKSNKCLKVLTATAVSAAALFAVQNASAFAEGDVVVSENVSGIATQFGDVNFDKSVGISDAVQLQRYLLGQQTELGNWLNADIDEDGVVDVFDFTMLRKQVRGQKAENGGTLSIRVVDVMTGKPLESVEVELFGHCSDYCYDKEGEGGAAGSHLKGLPLGKLALNLNGLNLDAVAVNDAVLVNNLLLNFDRMLHRFGFQ